MCVLDCAPDRSWTFTWITRQINKKRQIYTERIPNELWWCIIILCNKFASQNMEWKEVVRRAHSREPWQTARTKPESKEKVTLAYPLPQIWQSSKTACLWAFLLTPQATQPWEKLPNWNSRTLYKISNPLERSSKLKKPWQTENQLCPRRHGN